MFPFIFSLFLWGATSWATDVFSVGLRVNLEYSDLEHHCKLSALVEPHRLSLEILNGKVVRGKVTQGSRFSPVRSLDLTSDEREALEFREEENLFWIKSLRVSPPLLRKLVFSGKGFGQDTCIPPQGIATISPDSVTFDFGVESVGYLLPHLIHSNEVILRGQTSQGEPYRIKMSLTQDRT